MKDEPITTATLLSYEGVDCLSGRYVLWTTQQSFIMFDIANGIAVKATLNWDNQFEAVLQNPTANWLEFTMRCVAQKEITCTPAA